MFKLIKDFHSGIIENSLLNSPTIFTNVVHDKYMTTENNRLWACYAGLVNSANNNIFD